MFFNHSYFCKFIELFFMTDAYLYKCQKQSSWLVKIDKNLILENHCLTPVPKDRKLEKTHFSHDLAAH